MQRLLKYNLTAEIFMGLKHRIKKRFSSVRYRVLRKRFKVNNPQEGKQHTVVGLSFE
jgi:hypothetical protein